jgi:hypothetical protein
VPRSVPRRSARTDAAATPEALATRRRRAAEEPLDVRVRAREPFLDLEVRNPIHRTSYRVLFPEYPGRESAICTCTDFARRGLGTCKHVEAAWSWLRELSELPDLPTEATAGRAGPELWKEVDRRVEGLRRRPEALGIRDVEGAGAVLFEERPDRERAEKEGEEKVGRGKGERPPPTPTSPARP